MCAQALTGGSIQVSTLDGRLVRIPITETIRYLPAYTVQIIVLTTALYR